MCMNALRMLFAAVMQALFISPIQLAVSSRFGDSLLAEGLPQWLEKRSAYNGWPGLQAVDYGDADAERLPIFLADKLTERSQERLDKIVQYLDIALPSGPPSNTMTRDRRVDPKLTIASAASFQGGQQRMQNWHPIVFGLIGSLFLLLLVFGAGVAYNQKVRLPRKKSQPGHNQNGGARISLDDQDAKMLRLDGDRKLAHSAQMYHYQYQKQQMLAVEKANEPDNHISGEAGDDSDSDVVEGDFTVYECPGLASTGELEVQNPLFQGEAFGCTASSPTKVPAGVAIRNKPGTSEDDEEEESSDSTPTSRTVEARE